MLIFGWGRETIGGRQRHAPLALPEGSQVVPRLERLHKAFSLGVGQLDVDSYSFYLLSPPSSSLVLRSYSCEVKSMLDCRSGAVAQRLLTQRLLKESL